MLGSRDILAAVSPTKIAASLVAAAGVAIAGGVGYLLHKQARKVYEAHAVVSMVGAATAQLKSGLKSASPGALEKLDADLRSVKGWSDPELADAAEQYLIGAREILKRRAEADRLKHKAAASRAALSAHMDAAGRRDTPWIRGALLLKKQVERDYFDLDVQLSAIGELLEAFPEANKRVAPHVQASLLLEESVRKSAQKAVLEEATRARAELQDTRRWVQ